MNKMIYKFSGKIAKGDRAEGPARRQSANLAEMASLGISVPAGFTITTEVCTEYYKSSPPRIQKGSAPGGEVNCMDG
jgi:pyruvate,orthophosphate dikinase